MIEDNPVRGVKRYKDKKRERYLSAKELSALGKVLSDPKLEEHPAAINALRLLLFTGCRKSEILGLKWKYIDFEHGYLRLPESKTNEKVVLLGPPAVELLSKIPRWEDNDYVFPGEKKGMHFQNLQKAWERIRESLNK